MNANLAVNFKGAVMSVTASENPPHSVYGAVQLGYALVSSPRLAEWKRFAALGQRPRTAAEGVPGAYQIR